MIINNYYFFRQGTGSSLMSTTCATFAPPTLISNGVVIISKITGLSFLAPIDLGLPK